MNKMLNYMHLLLLFSASQVLGLPQANDKSFDDLATLTKPAQVIDQPPLIRKTAKRQLIRFGPYELSGAKGDGMPGGHTHGAKPPTSGGLMGGGGGGSGTFQMLDTNALLKGDFALALAKFLGSSMDPDSINVMHTVDGGLCQDCSVLGVKMDVVFENGTRADVGSGVYLHHIFSMNLVPPERKLKTGISTMFAPFCGTGTSLMETLTNGLVDVATSLIRMPNIQIFGFGAVDEFKQLFTTADGTFKSGFYFGDRDKLFFQAEVVNYRKEPQKIYIQMDTEYVPGKPEKEAMTSFMSTTKCSDPLVFKGNGVIGSNFGEKVPVKIDGTLLTARGHMHDGGDSMVINLNGKDICTSKANYGPPIRSSDDPKAESWSTIATMSQCDFAVPIKKGDMISLDAFWDKVAHPLRQSQGVEQEQMGLVAFTFVPN